MGIRTFIREHKQRHTPSGFGFALSDSIHYLDARWDEVARSAPVFLSRSYLGVLEEAGPENLRQRYALVYRGAAPVAAVAAQIVSISGDRLGRGKAEKRGGLRKAALRGLEENLLVCGNLLSWGQHGV